MGVMVRNGLLALFLPFGVMSAFTILLQFFQNALTIGSNDVLLTIGSAVAYVTSTLSGYVFARRVFPRHALVVAILYFPLVFWLLVGFATALVGLVFNEWV